MKTFASYPWARLQDQNREDCISVLRSSRQEADSLKETTTCGVGVNTHHSSDIHSSASPLSSGLS